MLVLCYPRSLCSFFFFFFVESNCFYTRVLLMTKRVYDASVCVIISVSCRLCTGQGRPRYGKVVCPTHRPPLTPGKIPGTHFRYRLSRTQDHRAAKRIKSMKNCVNVWQPRSLHETLLITKVSVIRKTIAIKETGLYKNRKLFHFLSCRSYAYEKRALE